MGKLIAKTAAITLACIIALALILFGVFTIFFPSVMLNITDFCGMKKVCAQYAVSVYSRSKDIDDLSVVVERGYAAKSWDIVSKYGEKLTARADFTEFCEAEDEKNASDGAQTQSSYAQYLTGMIAVGEYRTGDQSAAIETAFSLNRGAFSQNNAVWTLAMAAVERKDGEFASRILAECENQLSGADFDKEEDVTNLQTLIAILRDFCA